MAWEKRGNGRYYYRKRRIGQRVVSEYVGHSEWLASIVAVEEELRQLDAAEREIERALRQEQTALDREAAAAGRVVRLLTAAVLLASGYHTHRRQWRRRHEPATTTGSLSQRNEGTGRTAAEDQQGAT